jgi:hypothetical protein
MHKDGEDNKKDTENDQNYIYQFHYKGNVNAEPLKVTLVSLEYSLNSNVEYNIETMLEKDNHTYIHKNGHINEMHFM